MANCFVALPKDIKGKIEKTYLFNADRSTKVRQVLWGDWLTINDDPGDGLTE